MLREIVRRFFVVAALLAFGATFVVAQENATVKVRVSPPEAYIFVDGQPVAHRSQTISVSPGQHTIGVYNYGFTPQVQTVDLVAGKNPEIVARLASAGGPVNGPWGKVMIEDAPNHKAAVYVNGIKPEFFVGHVDEFNNNFGPTQKLVLPIGTYQLIVVNPGETEPVFNESIEVKNNERTTVNVRSKAIKYEKWHSVGKKDARGRFRAGGPSSTVAVAKVLGTFNVDKIDVKCQEPVTLSWTSAEAAEVTIAASPAMVVEPNGQRVENPTHTTTYTFVAKGPGGIVTEQRTVHVDPNVQTALKANPIEVTYRRIDDKVIVPANTTLAWSTDNAHQASIDPLGSVAMSGEKTIAAQPKKTDVGPVDEMVTFVLAASNNCGGSDKTLAAVHVTGTIEPLPVVPLASIFFPTAYPTEKNPSIGLLNSQNDLLKEAVEGFKKFLEYDPDTKIKIIGFADPRSSDEYNLGLSDRRVKIVKDALIALGVPEARLDGVEAKGETQQLDKEAVKNLEEAAGFNRPITDALVHAYNRRVDLVMVPTTKPEQVSKTAFPPKGNKEINILESQKFLGLHSIEKLSVPLNAPAAAAGEQ
jgi:OmpA family/PEGA domain